VILKLIKEEGVMWPGFSWLGVLQFRGGPVVNMVMSFQVP